MIDQTTPPFRTGDVAYTEPSPGGYASAAAVPTDPAFGGNDNAYLAPSLGGEFQPGSGADAPTDSPISKGADADGGAQDIADVTRIDEPPSPPEVTFEDLSVTVSGNSLIFEGRANEDLEVTVTYEVNGDEVPRSVVIPIPDMTDSDMVAAIVAGRMNTATHTTASTTVNAVHVGTKTPNVLDSLLCVVAPPEEPG